MSRYRRLALIGAAAVAFTIKLCLAWMTLGTNDVVTFELMLDKLNARGAVALYNEGTLSTVNGRVQGIFQMNHPPFALTLLRLWGALRSFTGLPLGFWLRLSCAMADLLVLWLLYQRGMGAGDDWWALLILALSPVAIMVSGFHGNTDPLMIALVV